MPRNLRRLQESGQSHFVIFSCYRRQPYFATSEVFDLFVHCLKDMRRRFELCIHGYVVMPEQFGEARSGRKPGGVAVEQLSALCAAGEWDRGDRIGMDGERSRTEGGDRESISSPRLAPKTGARTWGTRLKDDYERSNPELDEWTQPG